MSKIEILSEAPIIFTKDRDWKCVTPLKPGAIIVLPEDAVLYAPPIIMEKLDDKV